MAPRFFRIAFENTGDSTAHGSGEAQPDAAQALYRVCWMSVAGNAQGCGNPLPRRSASMVMRAEAASHPLRTYWLEEWGPGKQTLSLEQASCELKEHLAQCYS